MAADEERFPKINKQPKPNVITNGQFIAEGNSVHPSAQNVIVTGSRNVVGEGCKDIGIFNSSGCVVIAGVHGATLINTSGVIIGDHDQTYLNGNLIGSLTKKIYKANLTQSGTNAPAATIFENTIGNIVWTRTGIGTYRGTLTGAFSLTRTWCEIAESAFNNGVNYGTYIDVSTVDYVLVQTIDQNTAGAPLDDQLYNTSVLIEVYS